MIGQLRALVASCRPVLMVQQRAFVPNRRSSVTNPGSLHSTPGSAHGGIRFLPPLVVLRGRLPAHTACSRGGRRSPKMGDPASRGQEPGLRADNVRFVCLKWFYTT